MNTIKCTEYKVRYKKDINKIFRILQDRLDTYTNPIVIHGINSQDFLNGNKEMSNSICIDIAFECYIEDVIDSIENQIVKPSTIVLTAIENIYNVEDMAYILSDYCSTNKIKLVLTSTHEYITYLVSKNIHKDELDCINGSTIMYSHFKNYSLLKNTTFTDFYRGLESLSDINLKECMFDSVMLECRKNTVLGKLSQREFNTAFNYVIDLVYNGPLKGKSKIFGYSFDLKESNCIRDVESDNMPFTAFSYGVVNSMLDYMINIGLVIAVDNININPDIKIGYSLYSAVPILNLIYGDYNELNTEDEVLFKHACITQVIQSLEEYSGRYDIYTIRSRDHSYTVDLCIVDKSSNVVNLLNFNTKLLATNDFTSSNDFKVFSNEYSKVNIYNIYSDDVTNVPENLDTNFICTLDFLSNVTELLR